jgi:hypothetical protein
MESMREMASSVLGSVMMMFSVLSRMQPFFDIVFFKRDNLMFCSTHYNLKSFCTNCSTKDCLYQPY